MASTARIDELQQKFDDNPRRYFAPLANEYRKAGQLDRAIALCREHLRKQPGHMSGHIVYGQALYEAGEQEEARRVFQTALDLDPENVIALRHMGDIERAAGQLDEAHRWYTRVLNADPRNAEVVALVESLGDVSGFAAAEEARRAAELDAIGGVEWVPPGGSPRQGEERAEEPADEAAAPEAAAPEPAAPEAASVPSHEAVEIDATLAELPTAGAATGSTNDDAFYFPDLDAAPAGSALDPDPDRAAGERGMGAATPLVLDQPFGDAMDVDRSAGAPSDHEPLLAGPAHDAAAAAGLDAPADAGPDDARVDPTSLLEPAPADVSWGRTPGDDEATGPVLDDRFDMSAVEGFEATAADATAADAVASEQPAAEPVLMEPSDAGGSRAGEDGGERLDAVGAAASAADASDADPVELPAPEHREAELPAPDLLAEPVELLAPAFAAEPALDPLPDAVGEVTAPAADADVMPIEAFAYDAAEEPAGAADLPSIAAFAYATGADVVEDRSGSDELPPIDAFDFDAAPAVTAAAATEPPGPPSIEDFFYDDAGVVSETDALVPVERELELEPPAPVPGLVEAAEAGAEADEPLRAPAPVAGGSPFVTETMAELYLRQGFRDEALGVYRQLLASDPYNAAISAKVRELTGEHALVGAESDADAPAPPAAAEPDAALAPALEVSPVAAPLVPVITARAFFAGLARRPAPQRARSAAPPSGATDRATEQLTAIDAAAGASAPAGAGFELQELDAFVEPTSGAAAGPVAGDAGQAGAESDALLPIESYSYDRPPAGGGAGGGTTLDALFSHAPVQAADAAAASALATAFGEAPRVEEPSAGGAAPGRAARPATGTPSLDDIFRGMPAEGERKRRTTPTAFSFDQFFTDETGGGAAPSASGAAPVRRLGEESAGDLEQFNSWLESLKRK